MRKNESCQGGREINWCMLEFGSFIDHLILVIPIVILIIIIIIIIIIVV